MGYVTQEHAFIISYCDQFYDLLIHRGSSLVSHYELSGEAMTRQLYLAEYRLIFVICLLQINIIIMFSQCW